MSGHGTAHSAQHRGASLWHTHHSHHTQRQPAADDAAAAYKRQMATLWSGSAEAYTTENSELLKPLVSHFVSLTRQRLGHFGGGGTAVLDIASGGGEPGLDIAAALPQCSVVSTDLAPAMAALAQARAEKLGVRNLRAEVADAENLPFPAGAFDIATCLAGLMFFPDHNRALREWRRVLAPSGMLIAAVTGRPDQMAVSDLVAPMLSVLRPSDRPLCVANPRPFGGVARLLRSVSRAGFRHVRSQEFNVPMRIAPGRAIAFAASNPVLAELLPRLDPKDAAGLLKGAEEQLMAAARHWGYLQSDSGIMLPTNVYTVITAYA